MSKDVDSGITHYVCIHVASEITTKAARELDPTSPVALPKLPNGMAETPTARSAATFSHHAWLPAWAFKHGLTGQLELISPAGVASKWGSLLM